MTRALLLKGALLVFLAAASVGKDGNNEAPRHHTLTLEGAISLALKQNPDILKAIHEIERTRGQVVEIRAQALPSIQANSTYTQYDPNLLFKSSNTAIISHEQTWQITFQAQQILYSGGKVRAALKVAKLTQDTSVQMLREMVATVVANVRTQFYTALLNRELINVSEESIMLLADQLKDQQNRFDAGTVPRFNVLQAEVALANARPDLIRAKNNYHISRLQLAKTLGLDTEDEPEIVGVLRMIPRQANLSRALTAARKNRPILKAQKNTVASDEQQITVAKAGYKPQINANVGYEFENSPNSAKSTDSANGWYLGFTGNWAIFDGMATKGRVDQARASLASAKVGFEDSVRQVELEVQQAYANAKVARQVIESQTKVVEQALEALRLAKERLNAGAGTQLDVLNAQVALTTARSTEKKSISDYNSALAEYDRATGAESIGDPTIPDPTGKLPVLKLRRGSTALRPRD